MSDHLIGGRDGQDWTPRPPGPTELMIARGQFFVAASDPPPYLRTMALGANQNSGPDFFARLGGRLAWLCFQISTAEQDLADDFARAARAFGDDAQWWDHFEFKFLGHCITTGLRPGASGPMMVPATRSKDAAQ